MRNQCGVGRALLRITDYAFSYLFSPKLITPLYGLCSGSTLCTVTFLITGGFTGRPCFGSASGVAAMAVTVSMPAVTLPDAVYRRAVGRGVWGGKEKKKTVAAGVGGTSPPAPTRGSTFYRASP